MTKVSVPERTIGAFARSIFQEIKKYGFTQVDTVRLINSLIDLSMNAGIAAAEDPQETRPRRSVLDEDLNADAFPLRSERLSIREGDPQSDLPMLTSWLSDRYGQHFILSCATAQHMRPESLFEHPHNHIGIVELADGTPIGAVAFLDHDPTQRRAELRKLIGVPSARGRGFAEEATVLWLKYGFERLGLEKIYVSTLQNHLRNVQLNESIGFRVEGVLVDEMLIDGERHDVLRMGICKPK